MTEEIITPDSIAHKYKNSLEAIEVGLKAINPILWVRTHEEARLIGDIIELGKKLKMDTYCWSMWQGLVPSAQFDKGVRASGQYEKTWQPPLALDKIAELERKEIKKGNIVIMRDVHVILQEPIPRQIRDLFQVFIDKRTKLVFVSPHLAYGAGGSHEGLPPTLEKQITVLDFELPTVEQIEDEIRTLVHDVIERNTPQGNVSNATNTRPLAVINNLHVINSAHYNEFARALQGLTVLEVKNTVSASIHHLKTVNTKFLLDSKKQILSRSDILEYFEPNRTMNDIGGMDLMKDFFEDYKYSHTKEAREFGVEALRGVLMVGVPGCGKSQMCKAVSTAWKLPLIRLDVGKVMTGLVGGSESKMRSAIQQVEAIAPCILWIDEVEKALSGTKSSNFSDGGTMARVFGTLLTAMEEGLQGVTILATANDIEALPPEFIRRFSEVFFVDLPGPDERKDIFTIHLGKKRAKVDEFNMTELVNQSDTFTGAEIEKAVKRAMAFAFKSPNKKLTTAHVEQALQETKPISQIMGEKINKMRTEARGKYRYASSWAREQGLRMKVKKEKMDVKDVKLPDMTTKNKNTKTHVSDSPAIDIDD
jgi:ATP-dependent 26S proteasome regulatory subunit